jgi:hypothetical protein
MTQLGPVGVSLEAMSTKQEQRLQVHEPERVGGQRWALSDTWSATLATIRPRRIGPAAAQTAPEGRAPAAGVKPKPSGRGAGRLRLGKQSAPEHAQRALGGGAA